MYDDYIVTQIKELKENGKSYKEISKKLWIYQKQVFGRSLLNEKMQFIVNLDLNVKLAKGYQ